MRAAGVANPLLAQLPGAEEELSDPSLEPMPLDPGFRVSAAACVVNSAHWPPA